MGVNSHKEDETYYSLNKDYFTQIHDGGFDTVTYISENGYASYIRLCAAYNEIAVGQANHIGRYFSTEYDEWHNTLVGKEE